MKICINSYYAGVCSIGDEGTKNLSKSLWPNLKALDICKIMLIKNIIILGLMDFTVWLTKTVGRIYRMYISDKLVEENVLTILISFWWNLEMYKQK